MCFFFASNLNLLWSFKGTININFFHIARSNLWGFFWVFFFPFLSCLKFAIIDIPLPVLNMMLQRLFVLGECSAWLFFLGRSFYYWWLCFEMFHTIANAFWVHFIFQCPSCKKKSLKCTSVIQSSPIYFSWRVKTISVLSIKIHT